MSPPSQDLYLAMAGSPVAWAVMAFLFVAVLAPRAMRPLSRLLANLIATEIRRRLGLGPPPRPAPWNRASAEPSVEVLPPSAPKTTLRAGSDESLARAAERARAPAAAPSPARPLHRSSAFPPWVVVLIVCALAAVLSWLLLHSR